METNRNNLTKRAAFGRAAIADMRLDTWPLVFGHCLLGGWLGLAKLHWGLPELGHVLLAALCWTACLHGGSRALDAALARREASRNPSPAFGNEFWNAMLIILAGVPIAVWIAPAFSFLYSIGMLLIVLHALPPFGLKRYAAADMLLAAVGYGALTLLAGYFSVEPALRQVAMLTAIGFASLLLGFICVIRAQENTAEPGARPEPILQRARRRAVLLASFAVGFALANFGAWVLLYKMDWVGVLGLAICFFIWMHALAPAAAWLAQLPRQLERRRLISAWALTEVVVAILWIMIIKQGPHG